MLWKKCNIPSNKYIYIVNTKCLALFSKAHNNNKKILKEKKKICIFYDQNQHISYYTMIFGSLPTTNECFFFFLIFYSYILLCSKLLFSFVWNDWYSNVWCNRSLNFLRKGRKLYLNMNGAWATKWNLLRILYQRIVFQKNHKYAPARFLFFCDVMCCTRLYRIWTFGGNSILYTPLIWIYGIWFKFEVKKKHWIWAEIKERTKAERKSLNMIRYVVRNKIIYFFEI